MSTSKNKICLSAEDRVERITEDGEVARKKNTGGGNEATKENDEKQSKMQCASSADRILQHELKSDN